MELLGFIIKAYIILLLLRKTMTRQELYFNPIGKFVASFTEPIFGTILKSIPKEKSDKYIPFIIGLITLLYGVIISVLSNESIIIGIVLAFHNIFVFLMLFYIISVILGSFVNSYGASVYTTFFHRMGLVWVKIARGLLNIPGNKIIIIASFVIFFAYIIIDSILWAGFGFLTGSNELLGSLLMSTKLGLVAVISLLNYLKWLIIIRVLMTWVNPDPRNPIVQLISSLTDPVMEPVRKIIPPLGMIDLSPIILIFLLEFIRVFLTNFVGRLF